MRRRRFLRILAGAGVGFGAGSGTPGAAQALEWRGRAFGSEIALLCETAAPMAEIRAEIAAIEACFSLFSASELARLNAQGALSAPSFRMREVLALAARAHAQTEGLFDPTVQPLWQALARGDDPAPARAAIGFDRVVLPGAAGAGAVRLAPGQALTLNGVVQGYAADRVAAIMARHGCRACLIDMGEFAALGGPYRLAIEDPAMGQIGRRSLTGGAGGVAALATSSPAAMALPGGSHILSPRPGAAPLWSTVTVEGGSAALCDAASTAFVLMPEPALRQARDRLGLGAVTLVDFAGDLRVV